MDEEHGEVSYDEVFRKTSGERLRVFREMTPGGRALLVRTHAGRWLARNRARLSAGQIAAVEKVIAAIEPKWYEPERDEAAFEKEFEPLIKNLETLLPREDLRQLAANGSDYIPES